MVWDAGTWNEKNLDRKEKATTERSAGAQLS